MNIKSTVMLFLGCITFIDINLIKVCIGKDENDLIA